QCRVAGGEVRVRSELVGRVRGHAAEGLVEQDLGEGGVAVLAGRQDVGALVAAVIGDCRRSGVRGNGRGKRSQKSGNERAYGCRLQEPGESAGSSQSVERGTGDAPWHGSSYRRGGRA